MRQRLGIYGQGSTPQKKEKETRKFASEEKTLAQLMLDAKYNPELTGLASSSEAREVFLKAIRKTASNLKSNYSRGEESQDEIERLQDEELSEFEEDQKALMGELNLLIEKLPLAFDENKERLLMLKSNLYARREVFRNLISGHQFAAPKGNLSENAKRQMREYAVAVEVYRLEFAELQNEYKQQLQELAKATEHKIMDE